MFCDTLVSVDELRTSTVGAAPRTSTDSASDATFSVTSTSDVLPRPTVTSRVWAVKPVPRSTFNW